MIFVVPGILEPVDLRSFFHELHGIAYLDFLEQMPAVCFNRVDTDMAAVCDHLGGESFADQVQDFFFTMG
jgi:hypothetical protein